MRMHTHTRILWAQQHDTVRVNECIKLDSHVRILVIQPTTVYYSPKQIPSGTVPIQDINSSRHPLLLLDTHVVNLFRHSPLIRDDIVGVVTRLHSCMMSIINVQQIATLFNVVTTAKQRVHFFEIVSLGFRYTNNALSVI